MQRVVVDSNFFLVHINQKLQLVRIGSVLQQIAIEYIIKHGVNGVITLNYRLGDVVKPLVCELRSWYFLFNATDCICYLLYDLIQKDLFLYFWFSCLDKVNKSDVGGIEEVKRSLFFSDYVITHANIYELKVVSHYFWIFFTHFNNFVNHFFFLEVDHYI